MERQITDEEIRRIIRKNRKKKMRRRRIITICIVLIGSAAIGTIFGQLIGNRRARNEVPEIPPDPVSVCADTPFINTAVDQIGNKGGDKFWSWFGFGSHVAWCACYVSWCEDEAGYISAGEAPKFALVSDGANWFKERDQWLKADKTPAAGDLIFFDWEQDGVMDHVGIVTQTVDGRIFTVEGNSSDRCRLKRYYEGDPVIVGFAHINTEAS